MCSLLRCIRRTLLPTILICLAITFIPNIPPNATYIPFGNQLKLPRKLTPDTTLNNAERILEGQLVGAEAFTVHKGVLYAGLHGGHVVKILPHKVQPVVKTGKDCAGIHEEHICGRPLGLRVRNNVLYIADAYNGIYSHVLTDGPGKPNHILGPNVQVNGKPAKIFNCLEVDEDGSIYLTSSSSEFDINKGLHALLASGTGRLLKFDPKTKKVTQLLDNLHFANGLALSPEGDYLYVSETVARKILKYHIKSGAVETILEGLPGLPDNIQYAGDNTFWVSLVSSSDEDYPALSDVFADWPNVRRFLGRALFLLELPFKLINENYPNRFCELAAYHIGHLGPIFAILPEKVTIVRFDGNTGKILDVLHGNNGAVKGISDVAVLGDYLYLGSPANNYVGRLALVDNLKGKYMQTEEASKLKSDARVEAEAAKVKKAAEEARARQAAEQAKAKKAAEEAKKAAEEAKAKKAAEEAKKAAEEAKAKKAAEEAKKAAEEAKKNAEAAKAKKAAEEAKKAAEEAKAKKAAEEAKKAAEEAKAKKAAEEAKARKAAEEAAAKAKADKSREEVNKKISEEDIKTNKISEDAGKSKVQGNKVKTEL